jgi:hypothetical protein
MCQAGTTQHQFNVAITTANLDEKHKTKNKVKK